MAWLWQQDLELCLSVMSGDACAAGASYVHEGSPYIAGSVYGIITWLLSCALESHTDSFKPVLASGQWA